MILLTMANMNLLKTFLTITMELIKKYINKNLFLGTKYFPIGIRLTLNILKKKF